MAVGGGPVRGSGRGGAEETQGTKGVPFKGLTGKWRFEVVAPLRPASGGANRGKFVRLC